MKCPFRTEKRYLCQVYRASDFMGASNPHYAWVPCTARDAERITDEFADCIEEKCQAYIGHGKCARLDDKQAKGADHE